jgi:hypothetical protein
MATRFPSRPKRLVVKLYGSEHILGTFQSSIHCDIRTLIDSFNRVVKNRGRKIELCVDRVADVEAALGDCEDAPYRSLAELRDAVQQWRGDSRAKGDAAGINAYYNRSRVAGYTEKLAGPQEALSLRCAELAGLLPTSGTAGTPPRSGPLLIDLGCGSALSAAPLERAGCAVVGVRETASNHRVHPASNH